MRQLALFLVKALAGLFGLCLILAGLIAWQLLSGPWETDSLSAPIARELSQPDLGLTTRIGQSLVVWDRDSRSVILHLLNVQSVNAKGEDVISIPTLDIRLQLSRLLRLRTGSILITAQKPVLVLERNADGKILFKGTVSAPRAQPTTAPDQPLNGKEIASSVADLVNRFWWLGRMSEIDLTDAAVSVQNWQEETPWQFTLTHLTLAKLDRQLRGRAALAIMIDNHPVGLDALLVYRIADRAGMLDLNLRDFNFAFLGPADDPDLPQLDFPLAAEFHMDFDAHQAQSLVHVSIAGGQGKIGYRQLWPEAIEFSSLALNLTSTLDNQAFPQKLTVQNLSIDLGNGRKFSADGGAEGSAGTLNYKLNAALSNIDMGDLRHYWPPKAAIDARDWVMAHIEAGQAPLGKITLTGHAPINNLAAGNIDEFKADIDLEKVTLNYLHGLPPVKDLATHVTSSLSDMDFTAQKGRIDGLSIVPPATVHIDGLDKEDQNLVLKTGLSGRADETLRILNFQPLGYADAVGLKPEDVTGNLTAVLDISFPLLKDLHLSNVALHGKGKLTEGANSTLIDGLAITGAALAVEFDKEKLHVIGPALLNSVPADIDWTEHFTGSLLSEASVNLTCDQIQAKKFGIDFTNEWQGPAHTSLTYRRSDDHRQAVAVTTDLTDAALDIARLNWKKAPKTPAKFSAAASFKPKSDITVTKLALTAADADIEGKATLASDYSLRALDLPTLKLGLTDAAFDFARTDDNKGWQGKITGHSLDLSAPSPPATAGNAGPMQPLDFTFDLDRVIFAPAHYLAPVKGTLLRSEAGWQQAQLTTVAYPGQSPFTLDLRPNPATGGRVLKIETDDFGAFLSAVDWSDAVRGGKLLITGASTDAASPVKGHIHMGPYAIDRAPSVLKIVNLLTLQGVKDLFQGTDQTGFERLFGKFELKGDLLTLDEIRSAGPSLGFTLDGTIDLAHEQGKFSGTIVPAYGLNNVLSNIPFIGNMLNGGSGQGLFAATYKITGPLANPDIDVNPASVLAPGFLRSLFFSDDDNSMPDPSPNAAPAQTPDQPQK